MNTRDIYDVKVLFVFLSLMLSIMLIIRLARETCKEERKCFAPL